MWPIATLLHLLNQLGLSNTNSTPESVGRAVPVRSYSPNTNSIV